MLLNSEPWVEVFEQNLALSKSNKVRNKQLGLQASEVWSDAALAVLSLPVMLNYMDNGTWDASPEEIQELVNAFHG